MSSAAMILLRNPEGRGAWLKRLAVIFVVLAGLPEAGSASPTPVGPGDYTGSRAAPAVSGVVAYDGWDQAHRGFVVHWDLSFDGSAWSYAYGFTDADGGALEPGQSHWILEVSPDVTSANLADVIRDPNFTLVAPRLWPADPNSPNSTRPGANGGNPNLPADLYGIKLDGAQGTYTFQSPRPPVWGDFYAKDGAPGGERIVATAWNAGIGTDPTASPFTNWIPTPDTEVLPPPVPGPGALVLGALGLGLVCAVRRIRGR